MLELEKPITPPIIGYKVHLSLTTFSNALILLKNQSKVSESQAIFKDLQFVYFRLDSESKKEKKVNSSKKRHMWALNNTRNGTRTDMDFFAGTKTV